VSGFFSGFTPLNQHFQHFFSSLFKNVTNFLTRLLDAGDQNNQKDIKWRKYSAQLTPRSLRQATLNCRGRNVGAARCVARPLGLAFLFLQSTDVDRATL
jgi:predicted ATPase